MKPILRKLLSSKCFRLRDFILMMWKEIVNSTHVDIDLFAKKLIVAG